MSHIVAIGLYSPIIKVANVAMLACDHNGGGAAETVVADKLHRWTHKWPNLDLWTLYYILKGKICSSVL